MAQTLGVEKRGNCNGSESSRNYILRVVFLGITECVLIDKLYSIVFRLDLRRSIQVAREQTSAFITNGPLFQPCLGRKTCPNLNRHSK